LQWTVVEEERNSESRPSRKFAVTSEKHSERRQQRGYYKETTRAGASNGTAYIQQNHKTLSNRKNQTKFGKQAEQKNCCDFRKTQRTKAAARVLCCKRQHALVLRTARPASNKITRLYQTGT